MADYNSTSFYNFDEWVILSSRIRRLDSIYRRYTGWMELTPKWKTRLTDEDYTPFDGEKLPADLVPDILLKLYEVFSYDDYQRGQAPHRTLAACRLVCRRWSKIVAPAQRRFIIRIVGKRWQSLPSSWYVLCRTPPVSQDGSGRNQESDPGWCTQSYKEDLMTSHPKFLPELTRRILPGLYKCVDDSFGIFGWKDEERSVIQSTLAACCLVSREWNTLFTPILYGDIFLGEENPHLTQALLHRTFRQTHPAHKTLVKTMTIVHEKDGSTANLLSICFSMPNLQKLILNFKKDDIPTLHPNFVQQLRSLSKCCTIQMAEGKVLDVDWGSLPSYIDFARRSKSASRTFWTDRSRGAHFLTDVYFYIGKQEASASGDVCSSDIKQFKQHLAQTGPNLKGLYLHLHEASSLTKIDLRKHPHLRLLRYDLNFANDRVRIFQDNVIVWLNSICESITSKSLVVEVRGFTTEAEICNKIQDTLLALHERIETFLVYLTPGTEEKGLFSELYKVGIVVEEELWGDKEHHISFHP